jgi:hypothetical protein
MHGVSDPDEEFEMPSPRIRAGAVEGPDGEAVHRLAALSGSTSPSGAVLLAEVCGDPVAAIGIFDGKVVADDARSGLPVRLRLHLDRLFVLALVTVIGV